MFVCKHPKAPIYIYIQSSLIFQNTHLLCSGGVDVALAVTNDNGHVGDAEAVAIGSIEDVLAYHTQRLVRARAANVKVVPEPHRVQHRLLKA